MRYHKDRTGDVVVQSGPNDIVGGLYKKRRQEMIGDKDLSDKSWVVGLTRKTVVQSRTMRHLVLGGFPGVK